MDYKKMIGVLIIVICVCMIAITLAIVIKINTSNNMVLDSGIEILGIILIVLVHFLLYKQANIILTLDEIL